MNYSSIPQVPRFQIQQYFLSPVLANLLKIIFVKLKRRTLADKSKPRSICYWAGFSKEKNHYTTRGCLKTTFWRDRPALLTRKTVCRVFFIFIFLIFLSALHPCAALKLLSWRNCILNATSGQPASLVVTVLRDELDRQASSPITRRQGSIRLAIAHYALKGPCLYDRRSEYLRRCNWLATLRRKTCVVSSLPSLAFIPASLHTCLSGI